MADDDIQNSVLRSPNGWLAKGTAKVAGSGLRRGESKRKVKQLREYCADLCEREGMPFKTPAEFLCYIFITGIDPLESKINGMLGERSPFQNSTVLFTDGNGGTVHAGGIVSREDRILCARYAAPYMHAKLSSIELTDADGGPLFQADRDKARELSERPEVRTLLEMVSEKAAADKVDIL